MRIARITKALAAVATVGMLAAACGGSLDATSGSSTDSAVESSSAGQGSAGAQAVDGTVKIGYVTPLTGPLAAFADSDDYVIDQMKAHFAANPIEAGGKRYGVEIIVKDSQSDPKTAGDAAGQLINTDHVDIVLAQATPDTTVPVAVQCEANQTPCITTTTPWQPWVQGVGGNPADPSTALTWAYHFDWGLEDLGAVYIDMWNQLETNKRIGAIYANDADGQAFTNEHVGLPPMTAAAGYDFDNPGLYPVGTQDFSPQISTFKANDDQILNGVMSPPEFANFWKQAKQQGYAPKAATIAKALEFPAAADALGDLVVGLTTDVSWAPSYPTTSSLTGISSAQLAQDYTTATGKQWNLTLGYTESLFEVAAAAIVAAGGPDKEAIAKAMPTLTVDALVGPLAWGTGPFPNVAKAYLTGGQWRKAESGPFPYELTVVSSENAKKLGLDVPAASTVEPLPAG